MKKKQVIRLTESDLHRLIKESVNKVLRESENAFDEKQALDDYMMNIRTVRDELGLYMQGYCTINGKTVIKLNQRNKDSHTSLGFSLDNNGELEMHLIEDKTNSDIMAPIKVPSDFTDMADMYGFLEKGLEALWQYEGGFYFKGDDPETQWDLSDTMYDTMRQGMGRHHSPDFQNYISGDKNMNTFDWKGSDAMSAMNKQDISHKYAVGEKNPAKLKKNFKDSLYRK